MRATLGIVALLMTLAIGYLIYSAQVRHATNDKPLTQKINLVAVRNDLLSLGRAERLYLASNGTYATLEQLRSSKVMTSIPEGSRWGYIYSAEADGALHFRITASPSRGDLPTLSIDETIQITP